MEKNNYLALVVAYYLSKFDTAAYSNLGYNTQNETHLRVGQMLGVNPNSVKNMRDEFDPIHNNKRAGWYQRPLRPSRARVAESFQDLSEEEMRDIVLEILTSQNNSFSDSLHEFAGSIDRQEDKSRDNAHVFVVRGPTGRKAEEIFIANYKNTGEPVQGELRDTRDLGCGYDFEIVNEKGSYQVEVKGLDGSTGGIMFSSKEWEVAVQKGRSYYAAIVRNVFSDPDIQFINDPVSVLKPRKSIYTTVHVSWNIAESDLLSLR